MIYSVNELRKEFNRLLKNVRGTPTAEFTKMAETAFEAVVCVRTINEYSKLYGTPISVSNPIKFLNKSPGKFDTTKAFRVEFPRGTFYFAADIECYGLYARDNDVPKGEIFEADIVVIEEKCVQEIVTRFRGRPAPQHLHAAYECKFGAYHKSQLRELLGFRRHMSYLSNPNPKRHKQGFPYDAPVNGSDPDVQVILFRPVNLNFLQRQTAEMYDLHQRVYR